MAAPKNQGIKLAVALAILLVAGVIIAWSQGWFSSSPAPAAMTPDQIKQQEDAANAAKVKEKTGVVKQSPST